MINILFPQKFRNMGWCLSVVGLLGAILYYMDLTPSSGLYRIMFNDLFIISTILGPIFIVCSKEPREDEMTRAIRLSSILNALYAFVVILVSGTLFINGDAYWEFLKFSFVLFPLIIISINRGDMKRYYKENIDEE